MNNLEAVVFDMDGLLLDTEIIALKTFVAACKEYDFEPDLQVYYQCIGSNSARTKGILIEGYGPNFPYSAISELWRKRFEEETQKPIPVKPGVHRLLEYLQQKPVKKAVVTSTRHENALKKLQNTRILDFFEFVLGGDQITKGKPDPEMYLTACHKLNVKPEKVLALEDSENGVRSALNAGLIVFQIPDMIKPSKEVKALGHTIINSLTEVETMLRRINGDA